MRERDKEPMQEHGQNMRRKKEWTAIAPQQQMKFEKTYTDGKKGAESQGKGVGLN